MLRRACSIVMVGLLAACSTSTPTDAAPVVGWHKGIVVQAGNRDSLGPPIDNDCREHARPDADARQPYVEVRYFVGRHAHLRIVPIDAALEVAAGDAIWFRSFGCVGARLTGPDR